MSARVLTGGGDSSLETQIDAVTGKLVELLDEQRKKERTTNQSFWPSCEAAGDGYVGCNPLKYGECPAEGEFATTFVDKPFANTWSKDPVSGDMIRCIPTWMKGKATPKKPVEKDLTRRVLGALIEIEENYPKAAKDAEFQWNTPCTDAQNLHQCEIMRNPPSYNADGQLEYAEHGSRCMWRPLEDSKQYFASDDPADHKCIQRFDHPYKTKPLTKADLETIKAEMANQVSDKGDEWEDPHIKELMEITTAYGGVRVQTTEELEALQDAIVTLPVFPTGATVEKLHKTFFSKSVEQGGLGENYATDELAKEMLSADNDVTNMYFGTVALEDVNYANVHDAIRKLTKECNSPGNTPATRVWHADNASKGMAQWLVPQAVATATESDADPQNKKLKDLIYNAAKNSWWQFGVLNLKAQDNWRRTMEVLSRRLTSELKDDDSRKALELSLTPVVGAATKDEVVVDMSMFNPLLEGGMGKDIKLPVELNRELFGVKAEEFKKFLGDNTGGLHEIRIKKETVTGGEPLHKRLQTTPILKFKQPPGGSEDKTKFWNGQGAELAGALWESSIIPPSLPQQGVQAARALQRRGIGTHTWKTNISSKVQVTSVDSYLSPSEKTHAQSILRSLKRLKKRQLGERLNNSIVKETSSKISNRATMAYFSTLNAEHDVEERYRLAVAQIPKMRQWNFDKTKLIEFTTDEIKRRFHNTPGHALYYNRTSDGNDLRRDAATKLVELADEKLAALKATVKDEEDGTELKKALEEYRNLLKERTASKIAHKDLNAQFAQTFEDKFGPGTFIHPITGATAKQLVSMAKV